MMVSTSPAGIIHFSINVNQEYAIMVRLYGITGFQSEDFSVPLGVNLLVTGYIEVLKAVVHLK